MKTSFDSSISDYTKHYSFGSLDSIHMAVYIGCILGLIALYLFWRIFIKTFMTIVKKNCKEKVVDFLE